MGISHRDAAVKRISNQLVDELAISVALYLNFASKDEWDPRSLDKA
jgi:hypothetical protein